MTTDLNQTVETIKQILATEQSSQITNRSDVEACVARRKEIRVLTSQLQSEVTSLSSQYSSLPHLPITDIMDWAEDVLSMMNLAILVIDTTSLNENADIIRFYAIDATGEPMIDIVVQPQREKDPNTAYTGISEESINQAPSLADAWPAIQRALKGCFIVYYSLEFLESRLKNNIEHYGLSRLLFRADDLMEQAKSYFSIGRYGYKLVDACARIGYTLKTPALAQDRAQAALALLKAMSQGVTSAPSIADDANTDLGELNTDLGELDERPF